MARWLSWLECQSHIPKRLWVQFPGHIPRLQVQSLVGAHTGDNCLMFLSHIDVKTKT